MLNLLGLFNPASIYFKLATYAIAAAAGAWLCVHVYANPAIEKRELTISNMRAASEKDRSDFLAAAAAKQKESDREQRSIEAAAEVAKQRTDARVAELSAAVRLRDDQISKYVSAAIGQGLPGASVSECRSDAAAAALGQLLQQSVDVSTALAGDAERLADQVRALQAVVTADRNQVF